MTLADLSHECVTDKDVFSLQVTVYNWWMTWMQIIHTTDNTMSQWQLQRPTAL